MRPFASTTFNHPLAALHHLLKLAHEEWEVTETRTAPTVGTFPSADTASVSTRLQRGDPDTPATAVQPCNPVGVAPAESFAECWSPLLTPPGHPHTVPQAHP